MIMSKYYSQYIIFIQLNKYITGSDNEMTQTPSKQNRRNRRDSTSSVEKGMTKKCIWPLKLPLSTYFFGCMFYFYFKHKHILFVFLSNTVIILVSLSRCYIMISLYTKSNANSNQYWFIYTSPHCCNRYPVILDHK